MNEISGLKSYIAGKTRFTYDLRTRTRILAKPNTPEFVAEIAAARERLNPAAPPHRTLGGLWLQFQTTPEFKALDEKTQTGAVRAFNWMRPFHPFPIERVNVSFVSRVRRRARDARGRTFAKQVLTSFRVFTDWAFQQGHIAADPFERPSRGSSYKPARDDAITERTTPRKGNQHD